MGTAKNKRMVVASAACPNARAGFRFTFTEVNKTARKMMIGNINRKLRTDRSKLLN